MIRCRNIDIVGNQRGKINEIGALFLIYCSQISAETFVDCFLRNYEVPVKNKI